MKCLPWYMKRWNAAGIKFHCTEGISEKEYYTESKKSPDNNGFFIYRWAGNFMFIITVKHNIKIGFYENNNIIVRIISPKEMQDNKEYSISLLSF
jgi:hypothetical protein